MNKLLDSVYYSVSSPACYAGINAVVKEAKRKDKRITRDNVAKYLEKQHAYSTHKPVRTKFRRNKIRAIAVDSHWQIDLCDMQKLAKHNDGYRYILTCVDVLSKHVWGIPVKDKKSSTVRQAFIKILKGGRRPWWLFSDSGKEFLGKPFQDLMVEKRITHYVATSYPQVKCPNVERFNRTLKTRLWKYFSQRKTFRYINVLQSTINAINHSVSQPIGCRPVDVTKENEKEIIQKLYGPRIPPSILKKQIKYRVGDRVRISKEKKTFTKGYESNFTDEIFTVTEAIPRDPPVYSLKDLRGEPIQGKFYKEELVKAVEDTKRTKHYK